MTLIYAVDDEVFLSAPRDVLDEVVGCIEFCLEGEPGYDERMTREMKLFVNSLRAHGKHLPEESTGAKSDLVEGWLDT